MSINAGCADGWFGSQCTECGHCADNSVCDKKTGVCPFCDGDFVAPLCLEVLEKMPHCGDKETAGLAGPVAGTAVGCSIVFLITGILIGLCLRRSRSKQNTEHLSSPNETSMTCDTGNIAFNKTCSLSTRYKEGNTFSGDCSSAINGNNDTHFDITATPPNCIHTATNDFNPLWRVDLGRNFSLHSIIIYGRRENIGRMDCVEVSLDGEHVYTFPCPGTRNVTTVIDLSPPRHGRVVTITRHNTLKGDYAPFLNICEVQIWAVDDSGLKWNILASITTDGARAMRGKNVGMVKLLENKINKTIQIKCSGHSIVFFTRNIYAKAALDMKHIIDPVVSVINTIRARALNHRQFKALLEDIEAQHGDVLYHNNVRWLSLGKVLKRVWDLRHEILMFLDIKGMECDFVSKMKSDLWQLCQVGLWGSDCQTACSQTCQGAGNVTGDENYCDSDDGTCVKGCVPGYWGENCTRTCGAGCGGGTCSKSNGTSDWTSPLLQRKSDSSSISVGVIAGPVVAVAVAAVVVVIIVMLLRRRRQHKGNKPERSPHHYTSSWNNQQELSMSNPGNEAASEGISAANAKQGSKPTVAVKLQTHPTPVDKVGDIHINNNLSEEQSQDSQYVLNTIYSAYSGNANTSAAETNTDHLANGRRAKGQVTAPGTTQGPAEQNKNAAKNIYENVKMKMNSLTKSEDRQFKPPRTKPDDEITNATDDEGEDIYNTEDIYASYRSLEPSSILDDFQKSLLASLVSGRLGIEFAEFSKEMQHPHEVASMPENSKKNRFKALCAYDHSRVILHRPKGDKNTDYINANYIKECLKEKGYIATQGPRANTIADLWWMVWQENTKQIIMLSNLIEGGRNKCEEYWPQVGTKKTYGHVTVTALKVDTRADFIIRYFSLGTKKGGDQRTVSQYHYLVWPDHGVPSTLSLVNFWRYVRTRAQGGIPVVHCR
ncbi:hypothetical protein C0Q70_15150 [Pomacea canaliculata]|uniref:Tyrosine-protein phosphatase domain-containing protein n=1 Tax=Pomacea canaliculata TaxID=400727 RepID=A0A2T7NU29_POMCA|nr:hypothetical protein C0Q70_15150 [Pomacea canaliculata]